MTSDRTTPEQSDQPTDEAPDDQTSAPDESGTEKSEGPGRVPGPASDHDSHLVAEEE